MAVLITDPDLASRLICERQRRDGDRFDEVWEGLYVIAPLPNDDHQDIQANFVAAIKEILGWDSPAKVRAGVNVSDRDADWTDNYRCPDVVVFLPGNPAINHGAHWQGGPDFLVEIVSKGDRSHEKLAFYASVGVREVLIVNRNPWTLELYSASGSPAIMQLVATATPADITELRSGVLPITLQLQPAVPRPRIQMALTRENTANPAGGRSSWSI
jgi:Uma2 family endonuclease